MSGQAENYSAFASAQAKGQLISKGLFGFFNCPKKRTKLSAPVG
jgi:hypothetical protein